MTLKQEPVLFFKDVNFRYKDSPRKAKNLLNGVNLSLLPGEKVGILGDNGSGKTTISKIILGIQKPTSGKVFLFGKEAAWSNGYPYLSYIGDPGYSSDQLGLPLELKVDVVVDTYSYLCDDQLDREDLSALKKILSIESLRSKRISVLSKGERIKLMMFIALSKKFNLLVADEATSGLSSEIRLSLLSYIQKRVAESKASLIWITHKLEEFPELTDKVIELKDGKFSNPYGFKEFNVEINKYNHSNLVSNIEETQLSYPKCLAYLLECYTDKEVKSWSFSASNTSQNESQSRID